MTMMTPPPLDQEDDEMLVPHSDFAEGPQPMEVTQTETVSTAENQQVEDPQSYRFTWTIENFSRLNITKHYSDIFFVGGYKWRVLVFPKGNNVDHLSMYLDVVDSVSLPYGWSRYAQFSLAIVNQMHTKDTIRKDMQHNFTLWGSDCGFTSFMPLSELCDPSRGYLVNDTCIVEAYVTVPRVVDYYSKKETGYVGLKNQGATCYMNSLLQTLYHIPYFRKAVYHMPTTENDMPSGSIPLALQSLFYKLQYSDNSVATKELTKSFGWDTYDSFMQHDVHELNRVLCEKLEDKMKGTVVEGTIHQLFEGHHMNYIECINVNYKSNRKESFYDLQLDVKGCRDVYASFDKYVEVERLEGDNKYHSEQHGLQDAKKGVLFIDFPPVLQLQLKRFECDFMQAMVKINDRYEFPLQLDLDRDDGKYLSPDADRRVRNLYTLHSVLVHSGGVHGGHYYAFIRPTLSDQWFKFDDERVTKEDTKRALEEQYGGEEETNPGFNNTPFKFTKYSNAYMLVYIRESDKDKIICNVDEKDIAEHLRIRLKKEQEENEHKKKEKAEAHLYTIIKVARNEDLAEHIGRDIYFDLVDHDKVRSFRIQKQLPFNLFKEEVAKVFGVPVQFQRFWLWAKRQNHTYRLNRPLNPQEEAQSVGQLREVSNKAHNAELKLFLEVEYGTDLRPLPPPDKTRDDILLFFKLYNPKKGELRYVGRLFVRGTGKPTDILTKLNEMAGYPPNEEIELYEEIKFEPSVMCGHIDKKQTFRASQLEDGDIICYQKSRPLENEDRCCYPDVPSFLEYVHIRQVLQKCSQSIEKAPVTISSGLVIEEIVQEENHPMPADNHRSSSAEYSMKLVCECFQNGDVSNTGAPVANTECLQSMRENPEAIRLRTQSNMANKRKRSNDCKVMEIPKAAKDLISELPDAIIFSILSLLPIRNAVKTCVLSSRWRYLWRHISHLNFSGESIFEIDPFDHSSFNELNKISQRGLLRTRACKFMRAVEKILECHMGIGVETFTVQIFFYSNYAQKLDGVLDFAIASGTKELQLQLGKPLYSLYCEPYEFPCNFLSCGRGSSIKHMYLEFCDLRPPPHFDGFRSLKTLELDDVNVIDRDIENLLYGCYVLESLSINRCSELLNLKISPTCAQLRDLKVSFCHELKTIELFESNLDSLEYFGHGHGVGFNIKHAPQLKRAKICIHAKGWDYLSHFLAGLPANLPLLETLFIYIGVYFQTEILPRSSSIFFYLKHMKLSVSVSSEADFLWVAPFLHAAHFMETLELELNIRAEYDAGPREIKRPSKCPHNHLKSIQINGFIGAINQMEFAIYLLNNATALELMTINPANKDKLNDIRSFISRGGDVEMARHKAYEYLLGEVPSTVKLLIL